MKIKILNKGYDIICDKHYLSGYSIDGDKHNSSVVEFEPHTSKIFKALVEPGYTTIDIGANVGCTLIALGQLCSRVIGFEPNPETFNYLKENISNSKLNNVEYYNLGISDKKQDSTINHHGNLAGAFVSESVPGFHGISTDIHMVNLDQFCENKKIQKIDFIKIDVEGYELTALAGCKEILRKNKPICLLEMNHWCLNVFQRTSLPDFIDSLKKIFPFIYAIQDGKSANLFNEEHIYTVLYENTCFFKWVDVIGCFNEQQASKVLANFPPFDAIASLPLNTKVLFSHDEARKYLKSGWSFAESWGVWSEGKQSIVTFQLPNNMMNDFELNVEGMPFLHGAHQILHVDVVINDKNIGRITYDSSKVVKKRIKIPKEAVSSKKGGVHIQFNIDNPKSPAELNLSKDGRALGLGIVSMQLTE
ncbi:MAG: FkbM family methyltransferase [Alphaproteobacteria bacterium]|nr:FkbM family methyltransferase [Alphaproteobacteria bacterium]